MEQTDKWMAEYRIANWELRSVKILCGHCLLDGMFAPVPFVCSTSLCLPQRCKLIAFCMVIAFVSAISSTPVFPGPLTGLVLLIPVPKTFHTELLPQEKFRKQ